MSEVPESVPSSDTAIELKEMRIPYLFTIAPALGERFTLTAK